MSWTDLIVAIWVPTGDGSEGEFGTGIPIRPGLILTAYHVVCPENRAVDHPIELRWWHSNFQGYREEDEHNGFHPLAGEKQGIIWSDAKSDAALIACKPPADMLHAVKLSNVRPLAFQAWKSKGFPEASRIEDVREPTGFQGTMHEMASTVSKLQIEVTNGPDSEEGWGGASGMPILNSDDEVMGVFSRVPYQYRSQRLYAAPIWKLMEDPLFRAAVIEKGEGKEKTDGYDSFEVDEKDRAEHARAFLRILQRQLGALDEECREELAAELGVRGHDPKSLAGGLGARPLADALKALRETQKILGPGRADQSRVLLEVASIVAPAMKEFRMVSWVENRRDDPATHLILLPVGTLSMVEIVVAAADRRAAQLLNRRAKMEAPPGTHYISLPPDMGIDEDGSRMADQIVRDFMARLGPEGLMEEVVTRLRRDGVLDTSARTPLTEKDLSRVNQYLKHRREDRQPSYHLAFALPENPDEREHIENVMRYLRTRLPEILVFAVEPAKYEDDKNEIFWLLFMLELEVQEETSNDPS